MWWKKVRFPKFRKNKKKPQERDDYERVLWRPTNPWPLP